MSAAGQIAAYTAIRRGFSAASGSNSGGRQTIVALVTGITGSASGNAGTESDVARTLGTLQATTPRLHPSAALVQSAEDSARDAGLDTAVRDAAGLDARLGRVQKAQGTAGNQNQDAAHAGELAAKRAAVAAFGGKLGSGAVSAAEPEPPLKAAADLTGQAVRAQGSGWSPGTGYTGGDDEYNGGSDDTFFVPDEG